MGNMNTQHCFNLSGHRLLKLEIHNSTSFNWTLLSTSAPTPYILCKGSAPMCVIMYNFI